MTGDVDGLPARTDATATLAEAVAWTARALPARPTVPVLAGIRMQAGDELVLSSFDYDVAARVARAGG